MDDDFEPLPPDVAKQLKEYQQKPPDDFQPIGLPTIRPAGPLPVVPGSPSPPYQRPLVNPPTTAAIERGGPPEWLSAIQQDVLAPLGGAATAAVGAPVAAAAGPLAPGVEAGLFSAGTTATARGLEQANRLLGYRAPRLPTLGETATEVGVGALAYPFGKFLAEGTGRGLRAVTGLTGRARDIAKAREEMSLKLQKGIVDMNDEVAGIMQKHAEAPATFRSRAGKKAIRTGKETYKQAPESIQQDLYTPGEQAARATDTAVSSTFWQRDVAPLAKAQQDEQREYGNAFESLIGDFVKQDVPGPILGDIGKEMQDQLNEKQFPISGRLRNLVSEVAEWAPKEAVAPGLSMRGVPLGPGAGTSRGIPLTQLGVPAEAPPEVKWERLKAMRSELRPFFNSRNPPDRAAATILDSAITDAYDKGGFPVDPKLNAQYANWRKRWTPQAIRVLHGALNVEDLSGILNEDKFGPLVKRAPDAVRNAVGWIIRKENLTPQQIIERFSPDMLKQVFGKGADNVATWDALARGGFQLSEILKASPEIATAYQQDLQREAQRTTTAATKAIKDKAVAYLQSLGPAAFEWRQAVKGMPPEEAAMLYFRVLRFPEFGQRFIEAAEKGTPISPWKSKGLGSIPFAGGLAAMELMRRGEVTSPYAFSVPIAIGAEIAFGGGRSLFLRIAESEGVTGATRLLNRVIQPATRKVAMKALARFAGRAMVSDGLRALTDEREQPEPGVSSTGLPDITPPTFPTPTP